MSIYSTITRNKPSEEFQGLHYKGSDIEEYFSDPEELEDKCDSDSTTHPRPPTST